MNRPKVLAITLQLRRFTVQDVVSVGGLAENTVRDCIRRLQGDHWLQIEGRRNSKLLGRPAAEYSWTTEGRVAAEQELKGVWPLAREAVQGEEGTVVWPPSTFTATDPDSFHASVALLTRLVETLEAGAPGDETSRLWRRAAAELRVLVRRMATRDAADRTTVTALSVRLEAVREDDRLEDIRARMLSSQVEILKRVAAVHDTGAANAFDPEQMEQGFAIVIDASDRRNRTVERISAATAELSLQCFVVNVPRQARPAAMRSLLENLSAFLSTPLSSIAQIFILVDRGAASWRRASEVVGWFDESANLRTLTHTARRNGRLQAAGVDGRDAALLVAGQTAPRTHRWLGLGLNKQEALRLLATLRDDAAGAARGDAARIALNDPLLLYSDPPAKEMLRDTLGFLKHRSSEDDATLKGIIVGCFEKGMIRSPFMTGVSHDRHRAIYNHWYDPRSSDPLREVGWPYPATAVQNR